MKEYLDIGKIVNTHGLKGEVKVLPFTDNSDRFDELKWVYLEKPTGLEKCDITGVKHIKSQVVLKFKQVDNIDSAEALKGTVLKVDRKDAIKLPKDRFFICDLIGCEIFDENGASLGILDDILQTGSNDVYIVKKENKKDILIPALKSVVTNISIENKRIDVVIPKGLLDDEV